MFYKHLSRSLEHSEIDSDINYQYPPKNNIWKTPSQCTDSILSMCIAVTHFKKTMVLYVIESDGGHPVAPFPFLYSTCGARFRASGRGVGTGHVKSQPPRLLIVAKNEAITRKFYCFYCKKSGNRIINRSPWKVPVLANKDKEKLHSWKKQLV